LEKVKNIQGETVTWDYSYDELRRLIEVKRNGTVVESYAYDANGNRIIETNAFKGVSNMGYTYSIEDHLLTAGSDTYQFDPDGFLTSKTTSSGTTTYKYSSRGELLEVVLPDGTVISYDYDPMGRRIAKRINGTIVEKYLWSGRIMLLAVYDGNDNLLMRFNYADDRVPYSMDYLGQTYYLLYDQIGSLKAVVDNMGNVVKRIDYDSFGNVILDSDPSFRIPIGFAGGLYDADTGLIRFGVRDYDPAIGRWTAKDPIDFYGGDLNIFGYVSNDPISLVDPLGLFTIAVSGSWGGVDFSAVIYDTKYGWFPPQQTNLGVSTTLIGGGIQFFWGGPDERCSIYPGADEVLVSVGLSKYLSYSLTPDLSYKGVTIGLGIGTPISISTSMEHFSRVLHNFFNKYSRYHQ